MSFIIYILAWLVPGLAHWLKGERIRGAVIFFLVCGIFWAGLLMGGGLFSRSDDFVSVISSIARGGVGLPWLAGLLPGLRYTDMVSGETGACFGTVAGLLNLLVVMSVPDIGKHKG